MIRYVFREQPLTIRSAADADPQKIGEALAALTAADGTLDVHDVPQAARNPRNPLHRHFTWDDHEAAEERRLDQARTLIRSIEVVSEGNEPPLRAYYSISTEALGRRYHSIASIESSASLQVRLLEVGRRDLLAFQRRFQAMQVVCVHIVAAIDAIDKKIAESKEPDGGGSPAKKARPPRKGGRKK